MMKPTTIAITIALCIFFGNQLIGQDSFRSQLSTDGWGGNTWEDDILGATPSWGGAIWDFTNAMSGDRYFRFHTSSCNQDWGPNPDLELTVGNSIGLTSGNASAYFVNVQNTGWHYIFRTRTLTECGSPEAVYFEIQGAVQTISNLSQSPATVFPGQDITVNITLSGASNTGQGYYLRYTNDGFASSTVLEMTGAGTSYSAAIPGSANTPNAIIDYYAFSSGESLTIQHDNADFFTISQENNGGSNYNYSVHSHWESAQDGDWSTASTWTANAVPGSNQPIKINAHDVTTSGNYSFPNLIVSNGGALKINANDQLTLSTYGSMTIDGSILSFDNSKFFAPEGGFLQGIGKVDLHDFEIGVEGGNGEKHFYLYSDLEISNDLIIEENGGLFPGDDAVVSLEMSGDDASIYNEGFIDSNPDLSNTAGERLALEISGQTILRPNNSSVGLFRLGDITVKLNASLLSDAAGSLELELQFGTLFSKGNFNLGQLANGVVHTTLRGAANNNYYIEAGNAGQTFQFSNLTIGNDGANNGAHLQLKPNSETALVRISGDFKNYYKFTAGNSDGEAIDVEMNGTIGDQLIFGEWGQTSGNKFSFKNLDINNMGGNVLVSSASPSIDPDLNISFEITGSLGLVKGKLITLATSPEIRHNLIFIDNASISTSGAQSDEGGQPCYIEGPMIREISAVNPNASLSFPIGKGNDYRRMDITTEITSAPVRFIAEHFSSSANLLGVSIASPISNVSDHRFWNIKISQVAFLSNTKFTLNYGDYDTDGVNSEEDLRVVWAEQGTATDGNLDNDKWLTIGNEGGTSNRITSGFFDFFPGPVSQLDLTLGNVGLGVNPLPVTWLHISCEALQGRNRIDWATGSETNSSHFVLERSSDDFVFKAIESVDGQGWSNQTVDYSITDFAPIEGRSYYRVKQVDLDGKVDYSEIVSATKSQETIAYPTPFKNQIIVSGSLLKAGSKLELWSVSGKILHTQLVTGSRIEISGADLSSGVYFLKGIMRSGEPVVQKLVKTQL